MNPEEKKAYIAKKYTQIVNNNKCCSAVCCGTMADKNQISLENGYTYDDIKTASDANLGLSCGNPFPNANIKNGDCVLDLGCGAGFDSFIASKKVGKSGSVIGVDIVEAMIEKAKEIAKIKNIKNVVFLLGDIEALPIKDNTVDVIISNCVINLAPNKEIVFKEAYRVLKTNGEMNISDIVLLEELSQIEKNYPNLLVGCVSGAILKEEYLKIIRNAGFEITILDEDKDISNRQYSRRKLESIKVQAKKINRTTA